MWVFKCSKWVSVDLCEQTAEQADASLMFHLIAWNKNSNSVKM